MPVWALGSFLPWNREDIEYLIESLNARVGFGVFSTKKCFQYTDGLLYLTSQCPCGLWGLFYALNEICICLTHHRLNARVGFGVFSTRIAC